MTTLTYSLHSLFNEQRRFRFPFGQHEREIPQNGIYIIFENGEEFSGLDRIVRVGTHTGDGQLRSRLNQHFVKENKNRSIFRKNIGRCMLNKDGSPYLRFWELDVTSKANKEKNWKLLDRDFEIQIEKRISNYIRNSFSFCVLHVDSKEQRLFWESRIVSTLAKSKELNPSKNWLGSYSTKEKIKVSGLWQVNELCKQELSEKEFDSLRQLVSQHVA